MTKTCVSDIRENKPAVLADLHHLRILNAAFSVVIISPLDIIYESVSLVYNVTRS